MSTLTSNRQVVALVALEYTGPNVERPADDKDHLFIKFPIIRFIAGLASITPSVFVIPVLFATAIGLS